jgi:hypothetical protein
MILEFKRHGQSPIPRSNPSFRGAAPHQHKEILLASVSDFYLMRVVVELSEPS